MTASDSFTADTTYRLGYLTYVDLPSLGTVGGLLLVDSRARPIEFHCSAPLLPTRTQEILYGQTLRSAVLCDQIGRTLTEQLAQPPQIILTDEPHALRLRDLIETPIALFVNDAPQDAGPQLATQGIADRGVSNTSSESWTFEAGAYRFTASEQHPQDRDLLDDTLSEIQSVWDLMEPIERICEAVREAHRAAA